MIRKSRKRLSIRNLKKNKGGAVPDTPWTKLKETHDDNIKNYIKKPFKELIYKPPFDEEKYKKIYGVIDHIKTESTNNLVQITKAGGSTVDLNHTDWTTIYNELKKLNKNFDPTNIASITTEIDRLKLDDNKLDLTNLEDMITNVNDDKDLIVKIVKDIKKEIGNVIQNIERGFGGGGTEYNFGQVINNIAALAQPLDIEEKSLIFNKVKDVERYYNQLIDIISFLSSNYNRLVEWRDNITYLHNIHNNKPWNVLEKNIVNGKYVCSCHIVKKGGRRKSIRKSRKSRKN